MKTVQIKASLLQVILIFELVSSDFTTPNLATVCSSSEAIY